MGDVDSRVGQADQPDCGGDVPEPQYQQLLSGAHSQEAEADGQCGAGPLRGQPATDLGKTPRVRCVVAWLHQVADSPQKDQAFAIVGGRPAHYYDFASWYF